ncbi:MAG TPA: integrin alpha [Kofleriaceae bacterium]|nr:integrin alpha [Kofleriaceae bacterium]
MLTRYLRRGTKALVLCLCATAIFAGCDDGMICQVEALVVIDEPAGIVTQDANATTAGVQTEVRVRTTFAAGAELTLTVEDDDGNALTTLTAETDEQGNALFTDVTIPGGGADLRVRGDAGNCGSDEDVRHVELGGVSGDCTLEFETPPEPNAFYAPLDVFNASSDGNAGVPGHQGDIIVRTTPGDSVVVFLSGPGAVETQVGSGTATDVGELRLAMSLPEGQDNLRVACSGPNGLGTRSSGVLSVYVDTVSPTCALTSPLPGTSITPSLDDDMNTANGIQLELEGRAAGGDTAGEGARFVLTAPGGVMTTLTGTAVDAGGLSTADASFNPTTPPADFGVAFSTIDHAGNACSATTTYRVVYNGCPIVVTAPTTTVTTDADATPGNGAQVDVVLDVDDACVGRMVTSDCGSNNPGATVGAGGATTLRTNVCGAVPCESSELCTVRVTSADGIETTAGVSLAFDNQPPNVTLQVALPSGVACGGTVTPAQDVNGALAGMQVRMRVVSPSATNRQLQLTNSGGSSTVPANGVGGEVEVTILQGANDFIGIASDTAGNTNMTPTCRVSLADISVNFTGSPADGTVGSSDGTVSGSDLTFNLTGTVSVVGAAVNITVDGGAPQAATVVGASWSLTLALADRAAPYVIVASATAGPQVGSANLSLVVDVSPPGAITGLTGAADTRQSIRLAFMAPTGASAYRIKYATVALTDANFDTTGTTFSGPAPGAPGSNQSIRVRPLRTGTQFWVGIAAVDGAGNRSAAQIVGPLTPRFDQTAAYTAPSVAGNANFGFAIVHGRFNDDSFEDVAVSSPFADSAGFADAGEVYIYFGSAVGLATSPAVTIRGTAAGGGLGSSLTAVRWSSATRDDLAIGEPFSDAGSGAVYIFNGGAALPSGTVSATTAPRRIRVAGSANWFTGSGLGWQLATADHDGDGTDDLATSAVFGGGATAGAALVFYGGTVPTGDVRISDVSAAGSGTTVIRMYEQPGVAGGGVDYFGYYLHNLGPTQGGADATDDLGVAYADNNVANADLLVFRGAGRPAAPGGTREPFTVGRDVRIRELSTQAALEWGVTMGSISDQNGDGSREIVAGDFTFDGGRGVVFVIDGDSVGAAGLLNVDGAGTGTIATIVGVSANSELGLAVANNTSTDQADVDGDGNEDLVLASRAPGSTQVQLQIWFGPLAAGLESPATPDHAFDGPASFLGFAALGASPITASWVGDVNGDGLDDICWSDWRSNGLDGGMQVVWDDGN